MGNSEEIVKQMEEYIERLERTLGDFKYEETLEILRFMAGLLNCVDDQKLKITVLCLMAKANVIYENEDTAMNNYLLALDIARKSGDLFMISNIYHEIGSAYLHINQYRRSADFLMKAERTLDDPICRMEDDYYRLATQINIKLTLVNLGAGFVENSKFYLNKARDFNAKSEKRKFDNEIFLAECNINLAEGNKESIHDVLGLVIDGIIDNPEAESYSRNLEKLINILAEIEDFDRWEKVLQKYEAFAEEKDVNILYMKNSWYWSRYYKAAGN